MHISTVTGRADVSGCDLSDVTWMLDKSQWSEAFRVPAEHIWSVRPTICHDEYFGKWPRLALVASITNFSYVRYHFGEPLHASWHALTPLAVMHRRENHDWLDVQGCYF